MDLEVHLKELRVIKGYTASSILSAAGEALARDTTSASPNVDEALVAMLCNDVFGLSHECVERLDPSDECIEVDIITRDEVLILVCSGKAAKSHIHCACHLTRDGNVALARMMIDKLLKTVAPLLG